MRRAVLPLILCLLAASLLAACSGQPRAERDVDALRLRVERLERAAADERAAREADQAALREELANLRASLDTLGRRLAEASGEAPPAGGGKSPRAALRESLHEAYEASRAAVERLGRQLDKSLSRSGKAEKPAEPAQ